MVRLVGFNGHPTALSEFEIETLRNGLANQLSIRPHPYLIVGRRARAKSGPLLVAEGIFVRKKGVFRIVLSIDLIMSSITIEVDSADVEPLC